MMKLDLQEILGQMHDGLPEKLLVDLSALVAPEPTLEQIEQQERIDRMGNPHNETYHNKTVLRSRDTIIWDLRYRFAHKALAARKRTVPQLENRLGSGRSHAD